MHAKTLETGGKSATGRKPTRSRDNDSSKRNRTPTLKGTPEIAETPATAGSSINNVACNSRCDFNGRDDRKIE
jgi:hypothetical protein